MQIATLTNKIYSQEITWKEFFDSGNNLNNLVFDHSWYVMFSNIMANPKFNKINNKLKDIIKKNKSIKIYPFPRYTLSAFVITHASDLKVVLLGQDPYFNCDYYKAHHVPQAMGLSFSVPENVIIPSSLNNIFINLKKFGHIDNIPKNGNLWFWAAQGCLMLNSSLTVEHANKGSHLKDWEWATDYIINYISQYFDNVVFILWGTYAYDKIKFIDCDRHFTIISSHPSGLSANKPFKNYPAFMNEDFGGKMNNYLTQKNKKPIIFN